MPVVAILLVAFFFLGLIGIGIGCYLLAGSISINTTADSRARKIVLNWGIFFILMWLAIVGSNTLVYILKLH